MFEAAMPMLLLIVSHIIGDVLISSQRLADMKRDAKIPKQAFGIGIHCGTHALPAGLLLHSAGYSGLLGSLLVFGQHFVIDFTRCRVEIKLWGAGRTHQTLRGLLSSPKAAWSDKKNLFTWGGILGLDQTAHLICLFAISKLV